MSGKIYLIQAGDELHALDQRPYPSEDKLQTLLEKYPDLLAGEQMNADHPRRWLLVSREIGIPGEEDGYDRWSLDHLFLDQDGIPTLVEVKRSTDTRIRREVVGQMLDYAANAVVYWPVETIQTRLEATCAARGVDPDAAVAELVEAGPDEDPIADFWERVKTNLGAGRIRLVFVADEIPTELRRIVEFLNEQMDPAEVLAVEITQYVGSGLQTLVPRVLGQTAEAQKRKVVSGSSTRSYSKWDEPRFLETLEANQGPEERDVAEALIRWAKERGLLATWGKGASYGSFKPKAKFGGMTEFTFIVWTSGYVEIPFDYIRWQAPFDDEQKRLELQRRLNATSFISIPEGSHLNRRPGIPLADFVDPARREEFLDVYEWYIDELERSVA